MDAVGGGASFTEISYNRGIDLLIFRIILRKIKIFFFFWVSGFIFYYFNLFVTPPAAMEDITETWAAPRADRDVSRHFFCAYRTSFYYPNSCWLKFTRGWLLDFYISLVGWAPCFNALTNSAFTYPLSRNLYEGSAK